jgi:hypothetical protein
MRHEKYNKDNEVWLRCSHFNPSGVGCCSSCHDEEEELGYSLGWKEHPLNPHVNAEVCCGVSNNELDVTGDDLIQAWENALKRYEEGIIDDE